MVILLLKGSLKSLFLLGFCTQEQEFANSMLSCHFFQAFRRATKILFVLFLACAILDVPIAEGFLSKFLHISLRGVA